MTKADLIIRLRMALFHEQHAAGRTPGEAKKYALRMTKDLAKKSKPAVIIACDELHAHVSEHNLSRALAALILATCEPDFDSEGDAIMVQSLKFNVDYDALEDAYYAGDN